MNRHAKRTCQCHSVTFALAFLQLVQAFGVTESGTLLLLPTIPALLIARDLGWTNASSASADELEGRICGKPWLSGPDDISKKRKNW